jgi:RNase H-like protein
LADHLVEGIETVIERLEDAALIGDTSPKLTANGTLSTCLPHHCFHACFTVLSGGDLRVEASTDLLARYGEPSQAVTTAINLLSLIFAQIYFPTYSNSLKEIGPWVGFRWSSKNPSGVQSIIWRMDWERADESIAKENLITYNTDDCGALQTLTDILCRLCGPETRSKLENGTESEWKPASWHLVRLRVRP